MGPRLVTNRPKKNGTKLLRTGKAKQIQRDRRVKLRKETTCVKQALLLC
jgi:hypothetical protein